MKSSARAARMAWARSAAIASNSLCMRARSDPWNTAKTTRVMVSPAITVRKMGRYRGQPRGSQARR